MAAPCMACAANIRLTLYNALLHTSEGLAEHAWLAGCAPGSWAPLVAPSASRHCAMLAFGLHHVMHSTLMLHLSSACRDGTRPDLCLHLSAYMRGSWAVM